MAGLSQVAKQAGVKEDDAKRIFEAIGQACDAGEPVVIRGFGSFKKTVRAARQGRNPQTGEAISIAEKSVITFKASK